MANNNRNKSKSRTDDPDPVDSPLTSLASTSLHPPPEDDTIVQINQILRTTIFASEAYSVATPITLSKSLNSPTDSPVLRLKWTIFSLVRTQPFLIILLEIPPPPHTPNAKTLTPMERWSKLSAEHEPSVTLLMRGSVEPLLYKTVRTTRKPADIYQTLKTRCKRSDRQRKIGIVNKLKDFYAYEQQDSNAELIAQFQDFFLEVSQQNLSLDELLGLVLQSVAKPPIGVDENMFRNNLNHCLNSANPAPLLDAVCQELTQVKGELHTGTSTNPILINRLHPGGDNHSRSKNNSSGKNTSTFGHKAITNALAFQGQQPSTALMAAKGDTCKYCEIKGHWASTCRKFARDLRNGKINIAQLSEYAEDPQFNINPSFVKVRAVDLNATPDDTVLYPLRDPLPRDAGDVRTTTGI
ncbi:hypothetical protein KEM48_011990 [Puccinia striiformis f. sp. tritici PST-130]|nr:hypothetical protein KEM48_011990 [Puccinia striiformis f. sp. tritici PST-130]